MLGCNSFSYWEFLCPDWIGDFACYFTHDAAALFDLAILWRYAVRLLLVTAGWRFLSAGGFGKMVAVLGLAGMAGAAVLDLLSGGCRC
ncbi:hypothetical protein Nepgr_011628 [Nepenthes gracilis]|uniref:Uncharacterized protein n=1 Tax=Nepenthes gracilis TaxID=150966 RepID=A0AAD3SES0_NEPGR|nr:hypothetical protein Nepgr_011628 [Nepenthes gracilis]